MKKKYFLLKLAIAFLFSGTCLSQTIFSENFEGLAAGTFPVGWARFNVDARIPNSAVSYMDNAWIARANFEAIPSNVACSTSWYTPIGASDDWMITPAIVLPAGNTYSLTWDAKAQDVDYRDGYEVRISTTTQNIAASTTILYTNPSENNAFITRTLDLTAYAGQTIYLSWRNNSNDKFLLLVDNILVRQTGADAALTAVSNKAEYTKVPFLQAGTLNSTLNVTNVGLNTITNLNVTLNVTNAASTIVHTATSAVPIASLATGASQAITLPGFTPTQHGVYTFTHTLTSAETDVNLANNTVSYTKEVGTVYARDNNVFAGQLGIGAGNGGQLGQEFEILNAANLESVSFVIANTDGALTNTTTYVTIWSMTGAGVPNAVIAQSVPVTITATVNNLYTANLVGGNLNLAPGSYLIALEENLLNLQLQRTASIFTLGTGWVKWPTIPGGTWSNVETFGATFDRTFVIRPNFQDVLSSKEFSLYSKLINIYPNPAKDYFKISNSTEINLIDATIYDITGKVVSYQKLNAEKDLVIDTSKFSSGNYVVEIQTEKGKITKKLLVK